MIKCDNCGRENDEGRRFCAICGALLIKERAVRETGDTAPELAKARASRAAEGPVKRVNYTVIALIVALSAIAISAVVAIAASAFQSDPKYAAAEKQTIAIEGNALVWGEDEDIYYIGELSPDGVPDGQGTLRYLNGNRFEGEIDNGEIGANGTFWFSETSNTPFEVSDALVDLGKKVVKYEGQFIDQRLTGDGVMTMKDAVYKGSFKDGEITAGSCELTDGTLYEGNFKSFKLDGDGKVTYPDGSVFLCKFDEGTAFGPATLTLADGTVVSGDAGESGGIDGDGRIEYSDGALYVGGLYNSEPSGKGVLTYANKNVLTGDFSGGYARGACRYEINTAETIRMRGDTYALEPGDVVTLTVTTGVFTGFAGYGDLTDQLANYGGYGG